MIAIFLLSAMLRPVPVLGSIASPEEFESSRAISDVEARIAAAGTDIAKLQALAAELEAAKDHGGAKQVHLRVIELDTNNEVSRAALRHQFYADRWFESFVELAKYKREEDARMAEKGLVRFEDLWVPTEDLTYLHLGWRRNDAGEWEDLVLLNEAKQVAEWQAAGYQFRADDNSWIAPADFDHWTNLKFKCGDEWLPLEQANEFHSAVERSWEIAGEHFIVLTNCAWETGNVARWHADQAALHLMRVFGTAPERRPHFVVAPNLVAYNTLAGGTPPLLPDSEGYSSLQGGYFSDLAFDDSVEPVRYAGAGVCYFDVADPKSAEWGPLWIRWAAAQSYIDAIDRSWTSISHFVRNKGNLEPAKYATEFWQEKRIPRWLRYGAATYVERFIPDPLFPPEADEVYYLRDASCAALKASGGMRPLKDVFAFQLSLSDLEGSARLYQEAGLVVAFMLDGAPDDGELRALHSAFRRKLASGSEEQLAEIVRDLEAALIAREPAIRQFGGQ